MWVELTDGSLVNLDGEEEVRKWQSPEADGAFNLSVIGLSGGRQTIDLIKRATEAEIEAVLRRIRDALVRGDEFVSLRNPPVVPVYTEEHIKEASEGGLCDEGKSISNRIDSAMAAFIESDGGGEAHDPE